MSLERTLAKSLRRGLAGTLFGALGMVGCGNLSDGDNGPIYNPPTNNNSSDNSGGGWSPSTDPCNPFSDKSVKITSAGAINSVIEEGECTTLEFSARGGSGEFVYSWNAPGVGVVSNKPTATVCPSESTEYTITIVDKLCPNYVEDRDFVTVVVLESPQDEVFRVEQIGSYQHEIDEGTCTTAWVKPVGGVKPYRATLTSDGRFITNADSDSLGIIEATVCPQDTSSYHWVISDSGSGVRQQFTNADWTVRVRPKEEDGGSLEDFFSPEATKAMDDAYEQFVDDGMSGVLPEGDSPPNISGFYDIYGEQISPFYGVIPSGTSTLRISDQSGDLSVRLEGALVGEDEVYGNFVSTTNYAEGIIGSGREFTVMVLQEVDALIGGEECGYRNVLLLSGEVGNDGRLVGEYYQIPVSEPEWPCVTLPSGGDYIAVPK